MRDKQKIMDDVKLKIAISNYQEQENISLSKPKSFFSSIAVACVMVVSLSGMVFAKEISTRIYNKFLTGSGMETAINEGYIEETNMEEQNSNTVTSNQETGQVIEDSDTSIKVDEFVMDDFNLSLTFDVALSDKVKDIISNQEVGEIYFDDLIVYDENGIVLFGFGNEELELFKQKNNIEIKDVIGSGVNSFPSEKTEKSVKIIYNIYTGSEAPYPKSKELHFDINKIRLSKNIEVPRGDEEITIKGDWNFKVDVPKKMWDRQNVIYRQKNTTNPEFNIISATLYDTGMEVKMKFKAEKQKAWHEIEAEFSDEIAFYYSLDKDDELRSIDILNYLERELHQNLEYQKAMMEETEKWNYEKYLTNSKGEKFGMTEGPRENGGASIDDDGFMTSIVMFDLTKYDATDEITLHIDYKGNTADIVMEKMEEK